METVPSLDANGQERKMYECPVCPRSFFVWWNLAAHYSVHQRAGEVEAGTVPPGYEVPPGMRLTKEEGRLREQKKATGRGPRVNPSTSKTVVPLAGGQQGNVPKEKDAFRQGSDSGQQSTSGELKKKRSGERPKNCPVCGKMVKDHYARHLMTHSGEKPYKCQICTKRYAQNRNLKLHKIRVHHLKSMATPSSSKQQEQQQVKDLVNRTDLEGREKQEVAPRPYRCIFCEKSFLQKSELNVHITRHTGENAYTCDLCGDSYVTKSLLPEHMCRAHPSK